MMSDDSENDGVYVENNYENDRYYKKYRLLLDRCQSIQQHNEQLVYRIQTVKSITQRHCNVIQLLKDQLLKNHGEDWTVIPREGIDEDVEEPKYDGLNVESEIKEEPPDEITVEDVFEKLKSSKKGSKRKSKYDKDPKAPKRPSNPFFQFCQEQRLVLMEKLNAELKPGEPELTKQELTRRLAIKWRALSATDKKVYVDMYEKSKEKYAAEMSEYKKKET